MRFDDNGWRTRSHVAVLNRQFSYCDYFGDCGRDSRTGGNLLDPKTIHGHAPAVCRFPGGGWRGAGLFLGLADWLRVEPPWLPRLRPEQPSFASPRVV